MNNLRFNYEFSSILIALAIVTCMLFLVYVSYFDYRYRWFKRRYILAFYPLVFIVNYLINRNLLVTCISFFFLFIVFTITEMISSEEGIGTIDILIAPMFTTWLNFYSVYFILGFFALYGVCCIPWINKNVINFRKDTISVPLIPLMMCSFIIVSLLFPNNIGIFFNTI